MPVIPIPAANHIIIESRRDELLNSMLLVCHYLLWILIFVVQVVPECAPDSAPDSALDSAPDSPVLRITGAYTKKVDGSQRSQDSTYQATSETISPSPCCN